MNNLAATNMHLVVALARAEALKTSRRLYENWNKTKQKDLACFCLYGNRSFLEFCLTLSPPFRSEGWWEVVSWGPSSQRVRTAAVFICIACRAPRDMDGNASVSAQPGLRLWQSIPPPVLRGVHAAKCKEALGTTGLPKFKGLQGSVLRIDKGTRQPGSARCCWGSQPVPFFVVVAAVAWFAAN